MLLQAEMLMQGMIAENKRREALNQSPTYGEKDFVTLIDLFGLDHNKLLSEILGH
jgi:hypothetical protein